MTESVCKMKESCGKYVCCARGPSDLGKLHIVRSIKMTLSKSLCKCCYFLWNSGLKSSFSLLRLEKIFLPGKKKKNLFAWKQTGWPHWQLCFELTPYLYSRYYHLNGKEAKVKKFPQNVWNNLVVICLFLFANYVKSETDLGLSPTEHIKTVPSPAQ